MHLKCDGSEKVAHVISALEISGQQIYSAILKTIGRGPLTAHLTLTLVVVDAKNLPTYNPLDHWKYSLSSTKPGLKSIGSDVTRICNLVWFGQKSDWISWFIRCAPQKPKPLDWLLPIGQDFHAFLLKLAVDRYDQFILPYGGQTSLWEPKMVQSNRVKKQWLSNWRTKLATILEFHPRVNDAIARCKCNGWWKQLLKWNIRGKRYWIW